MDEEMILLKDARILYNKENIRGRYEITKAFVAEFKIGDEENWPIWLYKDYDYDIGNSFLDWNKWTVAEIIFDIFGNHYFVDTHAKFRMIDQLTKIVEMKECIENCYRRPLTDTDGDGR